jgi:WD40 repeat protein
VLREWPRLIGHRGQVHALAFSDDGLTLISGGRDDVIHVWNPESGELLKTLDSGSSGLGSVAYAGDGSIVAAHWRQAKEVWIYECASGALVAQLPVELATSLDLSPTGQRLLVSSPSGLFIWDLETYQVIAQAGGTAERTWEARFDRTGQKVLAAGLVPLCYDAHTLVAEGPLYTHALHAYDHGQCLDLTDDEGQLVVGWGHSEGRDEGSVRVCTWPEREPIQVMRGHKPAVGSVAFAPDGRHVISVGLRDSLVKVWHVASGRMVEEHLLPGVTVARFSPAGVFLVTGAAHPAELVLWEWSS